MLWEPTSILQAGGGHGASCLRPDGRKARPLSLQLKQLSYAAYSAFAAGNSPCLSKGFDAVASRTFASPHLDLQVVPTPPAVVVAQKTPKLTPTSSPINMLPNEVLCLIFDECLASSSSQEDDDEVDLDSIPSVSSDFSTSPLYLSHVCRHWRATAIAHRQLWSRVSVSIKAQRTPELADTRGKNLLRLLRVFLSRAKGTPLDLSLASHSDRDVMSREETSLAHAAFQLLLPHASKWRTVHFQIPNDELQRTFLNVVTASQAKVNLSSTSPSPSSSLFPELSALTLDLAVDASCCDEEEDEEEGDGEEGACRRRTDVAALIFETMLSNSPNLSSLVIDDDLLAFLDYDSIDKAIPWTSLKHISIECDAIPVRRVLEICEKALSVERLSVWRVVDEDGVEERRVKPVTLSKLRDLALTLLSDPRQLLASLVAPSVRSVEVDVQDLWSAGSKGTSSMEALLKPMDEFLAVSSPSSLERVHYRVKANCVSDAYAQASLTRDWCWEKGFKHLHTAGTLELEVYKF